MGRDNYPGSFREFSHTNVKSCETLWEEQCHPVKHMFTNMSDGFLVPPSAWGLRTRFAMAMATAPGTHSNVGQGEFGKAV